MIALWNFLPSYPRSKLEDLPIGIESLLNIGVEKTHKLPNARVNERSDGFVRMMPL